MESFIPFEIRKKKGKKEKRRVNIVIRQKLRSCMHRSDT